MRSDINDRKQTDAELLRHAEEADRARLVLLSVLEDQREAQAALRDATDRLTKLVDTSPGVIYSFRRRPDGAFSMPYASPIFAEVFGLPVEEVATDFSPVLSRIDPDEQDRLLASIAESARTLSRWHGEFRYRHPSRGMVWLEGRSMPVREADGSVIWHGIVDDVTERKASEEQLRQLSQAVEQSPESIVITNLQAEIEYVNDRLYAGGGDRMQSAHSAVGQDAAGVLSRIVAHPDAGAGLDR